MNAAGHHGEVCDACTSTPSETTIVAFTTRSGFSIKQHVGFMNRLEAVTIRWYWKVMCNVIWLMASGRSRGDQGASQIEVGRLELDRANLARERTWH